ncbi:MAG TPA: phosphotransferase [Xanthomonadales bacterium]|nr:phosphotransferase [Xanthomonadales bacterium]
MTETAGERSAIQHQRQQAAAAWAAAELGLARVELQAVSGDASFRRYFRLAAPGRTLILMDAPPDHEDSGPFVDIAERLRAAGLKAPQIHCFDLRQGFGLLEDFGDTLYRDVLDGESVDSLFPGLFAILEGMALRVDTRGLPHYGQRLLQTELDLFPDWYLGRHRKRPWNDTERAVWAEMCRSLIESAQRQPQVFVHKDFHSCNLLQTPAGPGIIDFQDGLRGPVSYDLVSLLWDRYIAWPRVRLLQWMEEIRPRLAPGLGREEWVRCCDWMGLQRNLKIVGIFARLNYRDGKRGYLEMIPRFYQYLLDVLPHYPQLRPLLRLLEEPACAP